MTSIEGTILNIVYRNDENGYTVLELDFEGELETAVGVMPEVAPGEHAKFFGAWTNHPTFGRQFKVSSVELKLPEDVDSIKLYLSSGLIKGVGEVLSDRIVARFGFETFDVIENKPDLLSQIKGISKNAALKISESFRSQTVTKGVIMQLQSLGLTVKQAVAAYEAYGAAAGELISDNPYRLIDDVRGIGFERADRIAEFIGVERASPFRINNGIKHVLKLAMNEGHTCLPESLLARKASELLGVDEGNVRERLALLTLNGDVVRKNYAGRTAVFLLSAYIAETDAAARIFALSRHAPRAPVRDPEGKLALAGAINLSEEQERAVLSSLENTVHIITGGPGTGKTTIINVILHAFERSGVATALCAPTGRAAKRMEKATGRSAKTIHRLLEYGMPVDEDEYEPEFMRNEDNPLEADAVIVDEASMIDVFLFRSLLRALSSGTRLVIVGDCDQLPSVGPGNVLSDLIDSGLVGVSRLSYFYRQQGGGNIVLNAHLVNDGVMPELYGAGDFVFKLCDTPEGALEEVKRLYAKELGKTYDLLSQTQVLSPVKKGLLGVFNLNAELRELLNPQPAGGPELSSGAALFRPGDKVMQVRNNYAKEWSGVSPAGYSRRGSGVFNGDMGRIVHMDLAARELTILFDGEREAVYSANELDQIELAYAVTVHKAQGSEFDAVVLPLFYGASPFLTRNLLYTALTRAREKAIIVGLKSTIEHMVSNNRIQRRYTVLKREVSDLMDLFGGET